MAMYGPLTEEQQRMLYEEMERKRNAALGGAAPLDAIIPRKQRPAVSDYDTAIQEAQQRGPNIGQVLGAGFAGFGQALSGEKYLDRTLSEIDANRKREVESAQTSKTLFDESDERNPESPTSKEFQSLAAQLTGRKPEDVAGMSAYEIKKVLPSLEKQADLRMRSDERRDRQQYQERLLDVQRENAAATRDLAREKMDVAAAEKAAKPTKGQEALDREFGKDYADYVAGGGYATVQGQIEQLRNAKNELDNTQASGFFVGMMPDAVRKRVLPSGFNIQQNIEYVVQESLRRILGAQFTKEEGERLMARTFDPSLPEEINKARADALLGKLEKAAAAKDEAIQYFEQNGTLKGYSGKLYGRGELASEFESELEGGAYKPKGAPEAVSPTAPYDDPDKEKRYQDWKAAQKGKRG